MEERGTPASATPPEFPFTPSDIPIETESRGGEDEDAEAVARRLARGKSVVGESHGQEKRDPLAAPLFTPPVGSSRGQGVSLRDTLECADPRDLSARLAEAPSLASILAREEALQEAEREEEERQRARKGPRVTLVQEVEAAARERVAFSEASYVPRVHFFVPFGVDAFVPRQSLQEGQVLHDPGSHMGMSGPLERLLGALGGNESEAAIGASGSRGSRRGGASSRRRVVSVVTQEGIEGEIAIPSRSVSITLPEAKVPRAWAENVYRLLLDCFMVIRQGAMGVSPEVLPRGATAAAQRGGARRRSSSSGPIGREGGREGSSSRGGGRGEATSRGRGVWVTRQPRGGTIHRPRTKNARSSPPQAESTPSSGRVLRERRTQLAETVKGSALASLKGLRDLFPKVPVNPFKKIGIAKTLFEKLGISNNATKSLTEGRVLNIPHLINQFRGNSCRFYQRTWGARITILRDPYPSVLLPQDYEDWLIQDVETRIGWNEE
ncbi:hypothetical protein RHSIM_Rhsim05G0118800 [Rhododendron simsii]|uniref:Uncharacterized protein n=1 Tax=Rhododendron simsii TaxID=118357 RepID=A0A834H9A1_RHOSS|nr:hypothetical protein RHSIM_Rhsim05G0118800 [Rhododendron simsii]